MTNRAEHTCVHMTIPCTQSLPMVCYCYLWVLHLVLHLLLCSGAMHLRDSCLESCFMVCCRTFHRHLHRTWALKFIAALTTRLGQDGILPYLNQIMQPLYRIQESGSAPNTDEVRMQVKRQPALHSACTPACLLAVCACQLQ